MPRSRPSTADASALVNRESPYIRGLRDFSPLGGGVSASARTSMTKVGMAAGDDGEDPSPPLAPPITVVPQTEPKPETEDVAIPQNPQTYLTFLTVSGKRRSMTFEPEITVGRVKELVWNAWPTDWHDDGERPPAPSYLRILYMGKILQDDDTLASTGLPSHIPSPTAPKTIVHLSIRLTPPSGNEHGDSIFKKKRRSSTSEPAGCCDGCIIS